jgi:flagella basal body P-ring formation protein FlgA
MMMLATFAVAGCLAVGTGSDQILAGDLAAALPGLTVPAPGIPVAIAPGPGVQRVFRVAELRRMATRYGWSGEPETDICVERPVAPPDPDRFLAAMRQAIPDGDITILDYGRQPVPAGAIEFLASGLRTGSTDSLWIGYVRYTATRRFTVWARVRALVPVTRLIAAVNLEPGRAIIPDQLRAETQRGPLPSLPVLKSVEEAAGKWPRTEIHAGTAIRAAMLENARDVVRGDSVTVDASNGGAHLQFEGVAEGTGSVGEIIPVLNPDSHRRFPARVEGKGRVSVAIPAARVNP